MTDFHDRIELSATSRRALEEIKRTEKFYSGDELTDEQAIVLAIGFTMLWVTGIRETVATIYHKNARAYAMSDHASEGGAS